MAILEQATEETEGRRGGRRALGGTSSDGGLHEPASSFPSSTTASRPAATDNHAPVRRLETKKSSSRERIRQFS